MTLDLVIPVADTIRNESLVLSLDMIEKHASNLRVVVMGNHFVSANDPRVALTIPVLQGHNTPIFNTDMLMRMACTDRRISDPFVWTNDDIFWLRPVSLPELVHISQTTKGDLRSNIKKGTHGLLAHQAYHSLNALNRPTWDYERHVPMVIHKDTMLQALSLTGSKRSLYGNLNWDYPSILAKDVKLFDPAQVSVLPDGPFVSVAPEFRAHDIRELLGLPAVIEID